MRVPRIALIFDDRLRPDTTGVYCRRALRWLAQVDHFQPEQQSSVDLARYDLLLNIDDGLDYTLRSDVEHSILWAIDTHLDPSRIINRARSAKHVFTAQREGLSIMRRHGVEPIAWLPLAADPDIHRPHPAEHAYDVCFIGHINCPERAEMARRVKQRFSRHFVGQAFFHDMAHVYSQSKIALNQSVGNDVNMRVFEAMACGACLLTNQIRHNGLEDLFDPVTELHTFESLADMERVAADLLQHEQMRHEIAKAGRLKVLRRHTYLHRMQALLEIAADARWWDGRFSRIESSTSAGGDSGFTSIVIVTWNQLPYTKMCLESIRRCTRESYEIIVVDNGSEDGTREYLQPQPDIKLIGNPSNRGFPAAVNQGIAASRGEHIVLLNNDVIVTEGWLDRMLEAMHSAPDVGMVGPLSNEVSGEQRIHCTYDSLVDLEEFARSWSGRHRRQYQPSSRLVGFCLLLSRRLLDQVGALDEGYGIGNFEDDDLCRRSLQAGYCNLIAKDVFVHHFGSRTFAASGFDVAALMHRNQARFSAKWLHRGMSQTSPHAPVEVAPPNTRTDGWGIQVDPDGLLRLQESRPRLSLVMIVRDSSHTIDACLDSIYPWVDELVIVDTGSTDDTVERILRYGARVFHFPWCDNFAAARNESLRHARGEWCFWMDADDTIDDDNGRRLRQVVAAHRDAAILGYVMQVHCPGSNDDGIATATAVDHIKLVRNLPDIRFEGRIHEQVLPSIRRLGGEVAWTDVHVVHSGSDGSIEGRRRKHDRDLRLLEFDLKERPDHPFVLFNLGMTYADMGEHGRAIEWLERSIEKSGPAESHLRKAYALLVHAMHNTGRTGDARRIANDAAARFEGDAELLFSQGVLAMAESDYPEAESAFRRLMAQPAPRYFASIDIALRGFKAHHNLALVLMATGRYDEAAEHWRAILRDHRAYEPAWRGLFDSLVASKAYDEAEAALGSNTFGPGEAFRASLLAQLAMARGDLAGARRRFSDALGQHPDDERLLLAWCEFLFHHGSPGEAAAALGDLTRRRPDDPSACHNLGAALLQAGDAGGAVQSLHRSLVLRPNSKPTRDLLVQAEALLRASAVTPT